MRVLVTRPQREAQSTGARLVALGYRPVLAPALEIVSRAAPFPDASFDLVLATSAHAFAGQRKAAISAPLACVGEMTAKAGAAIGYQIAVVAPDSAGLLAALTADARPKSALYLAGRTRSHGLENGLAQVGWRLNVVETYEARALAHWPADVLAALNAGEIACVLHYSPRSAALFLDLAGPAAKLCRHICISSAAGAPLAQVGLSFRVAARPNEDSMIALLGEGDDSNIPKEKS